MSRRKGSGARAARVGALVFTLIALLLTALTAFLLANLMRKSKYANEPVKEVVVAATTINAAEEITEKHLRMVKWPVSSIPEGAFNSIKAVLGDEKQIAVSPIIAGEPILRPRLASGRQGTGMAKLIDPRLRAFPVAIDRWIAEARLVYPGAWVDVLATMKNPEERYPETKLALQRLKVLAVDGFSDVVSMAADKEEKKKGKRGSGGRRKSVVTLLVTPPQAETLALISREGKVDLVLRNASDEGMVDTDGASPYELLGIPTPAEIAEEEALLAEADALQEEAGRGRGRRGKRKRGRKRSGRFPSKGRMSAVANARKKAREKGRRGRGGVKTIKLEAR